MRIMPKKFFVILIILIIFALTCFYFVDFKQITYNNKITYSPESIFITSFSPKLIFPIKPSKELTKKCKVFLPNKQPSVLIDGERYPKHVPLHHNHSINFSCLNKNRNINNKRILLWTSFQGLPIKNDLEDLIFKQNSKDVFDQLRCPVNNCELTLNRSKVQDSAIVLFHLRNEINGWPTFRHPSQRWVRILLLIHTREKRNG